MAKEYLGQCRYCKKDFSKREIKTHIKKCPERIKNIASENSNDAFHLLIKSPHNPLYWLVVEAHNEAKLKDLDNFIRNIWVECCGHLSLFGDYGSERAMQRQIDSTIPVGDSIGYIYDFGTSTELVITNWGITSATENLKKDKIYLEARNYLPEAKCSCGKDATSICTTCMYEDEDMTAIFCDKCTEEHEDNDEHYMLPIANSPRCGACGYEGDQEDPRRLF